MSLFSDFCFFLIQSYKDFLKKYENETEELACRSPSTESNDSKVFCFGWIVT
jgi:ABC-type transporter MlaC component